MACEEVVAARFAAGMHSLKARRAKLYCAISLKVRFHRMPFVCFRPQKAGVAKLA
jgi:hypothetical protein